MSVEKLAKKELRELQSLTLIDTGSQAYPVAKHIIAQLKRAVPEGEPTIALCREELGCKLMQEMLCDKPNLKRHFMTSIKYDDLHEYAKKHGLEVREPQWDADVKKLIEETGDPDHSYPALRKTYDWMRENLEKKNKKE